MKNKKSIVIIIVCVILVGFGALGIAFAPKIKSWFTNTDQIIQVEDETPEDETPEDETPEEEQPVVVDPEDEYDVVVYFSDRRGKNLIGQPLITFYVRYNGLYSRVNKLVNGDLRDECLSAIQSVIADEELVSDFEDGWVISPLYYHTFSANLNGSQLVYENVIIDKPLPVISLHFNDDSYTNWLGTEYKHYIVEIGELYYKISLRADMSLGDCVNYIVNKANDDFQPEVSGFVLDTFEYDQTVSYSANNGVYSRVV